MIDLDSVTKQNCTVTMCIHFIILYIPSMILDDYLYDQKPFSPNIFSFPYNFLQTLVHLFLQLSWLSNHYGPMKIHTYMPVKPVSRAYTIRLSYLILSYTQFEQGFAYHQSASPAYLHGWGVINTTWMIQVQIVIPSLSFQQKTKQD